MQLPRGYAMTCYIEAIYSTLEYSTLHIGRRSSVLGKRKVCNPKVAGLSLLCDTVFIPTMFACWHTSLQVKIHNQKDWSETNQIEYTGLRQIHIFNLFVGCFYRKGPAFSSR